MIEDRVLRTNQIINRQQDYQTQKLGFQGDNQQLKKENWKQNDEINKREFGNYERQKQNMESKNHQQSYQIVINGQVEKELNNYNSKLKESYYYEQSRPLTAIYQSREDKYDQIHFKTEDRQRIEQQQQQITHSSDKYLSKQTGLPYGTRTPMDPKSNLISNTPYDRLNQNTQKNEHQQYQSIKRDFKLPEYQKIYPESTSNKNNLGEYTDKKDQTQIQSSFQDIEKRLQQRKEQVEKIAEQQECRLNYYSKSQEYSHRQQGQEGSSIKMKQFQEQLRNEVQNKLKDQQKQHNLNEDKKQYERDGENKQKNKEILELDQFKYTQLDEKFKFNDKKNNGNQDYGINLRKSKFDEKSPFQARINTDSKYQQISDHGKYHFSQKQEFDLHHNDRHKYNDRSHYQNKSLNEDISDLRYQGNMSNESYDRLIYKEKLNNQQYQVKREYDQSLEIQRRHNLYDKLQQFDRSTKEKYQDGQIQQTKNYDVKQSIESKNQYIGQQQYIKKNDLHQEKIEFKRSQFQPEINQIKVELEKRYGCLKPEIAPQMSEFDKRRVFENTFKPESISTKIAGAREYLGQKYYQRDQNRYGQRHSYHEESSSHDGYGVEKGNKRNYVNKAIDDILQGTALSKYIEREKNQNRIANSKINYQKSPINDKEQYDRLYQLKRQLGNDRYAINEFQKRQPSDQNLQKYCSQGGLIHRQFGNYDRKDRRI